jgi:hypothetical protein
MTRSFAGGFERFRVLAMLLLGLAALLFLGVDRAAADEPGVEDAPPAILGGEVSPSSLSYEGGNVQVSADVVDDVAVWMVYAQVYGPNGNQSFQLFQGNENTYYGTLEVPPNPSDSAVAYEVEIQAYDSNNAYVASTIGGVQVEGTPQFDEPPYVLEPLLTPTSLPSAGGSVTISADAYDNRALTGVHATIALPGGGSAEVPLQPLSSSRYEGSFTAPANLGSLGAEYPVEIVAEDDAGQQGRVSAGTITVEAPPPPLSAGVLEAWPAGRSFGTVRVGKAAERLAFVRDILFDGSEPVAATARIVGSPAFSLPGAPAEGLHIVLRPGEKRAIAVEFRPTGAGQQAASLEIVRDDGGQPGLAVSLSGRGVAAGR